MKKLSVYKIATLIAFLMISSVSFSQILAWQFALPEPSDGKAKSAEATTISPNLEKSVLTRGPGAQPKAGNARGFSGNLAACETLEDAQAVGAYYQFTVQPKKGKQVSLRTLSFNLRRQEESAYIYRWMYSLDGKNFKELGDKDGEITDMSNSGVKQPNLDLTVYPELQNVPAGKTITFRLYAWGGKTNTGKAIAFGFGKSNSKGSNVLALSGSITDIK